MSVKVNIRRQESADKEPYWQSFKYSGERHVSVATMIDAINRDIAASVDSGERPVEWECSCEQGLCGACAMVVNDRPGLSCQMFCDELLQEQPEISIQALSKFPVVRDLVVDRSEMFEAMKEMKLWLEAPAKVRPAHLPLQYEVSQCLMCGSCLEACPNYSLGETFTGMPAAMSALNLTLLSENKAYKKQYTKRVYEGCSKSLACQEVCPMDIPIVEAVSKMNRISVWSLWNLLGKREQPALMAGVEAE
ncbi:succinate dehydrogenase/fumarate reductase iron-sulfur subunit [Paenibacillus tengchongensis]|uniref:succinate dehydrogenase/fumarate reductase iron-sulfur subunit n=1 Tax=Paenibacillus tengchongensis TaxID=2608684 RepID=UPI00124F0398|nr:2Fe-2S iron-sulfur cluster-binding protein [Paenibacillus tengchongensis]